MSDLVAFLSDVQGCLPAFKEALAALKRKGVAEVHCLGNLVGNAAGDPNEVVSLARKLQLPCVRGPFEAALAGGAPPPRLFPTEEARLAFEATVARLADELEKPNLRFLQALPPERRFGRGGTTVLATYGRVGTPWKALAPDAPVSAARQEIEAGRAALVVLGTPGIPFERAEGASRLVATGALYDPRHHEGVVTLVDFETGSLSRLAVPYVVD